jgi:hypothetical protein
MIAPIAAFTNHGAWGVALIIGLVAALAVAGLLLVLIRTVTDIDKTAQELLGVAGEVAGNKRRRRSYRRSSTRRSCRTAT